jgi:hypothetical protein
LSPQDSTEWFEVADFDGFKYSAAILLDRSKISIISCRLAQPADSFRNDMRARRGQMLTSVLSILEEQVRMFLAQTGKEAA